MTPEERGRRIKEARISKKMTQSEVVGTFITRNMLSQIESGGCRAVAENSRISCLCTGYTYFNIASTGRKRNERQSSI